MFRVHKLLFAKTQNDILVLGCQEHLVPKYSLPDGEFDGRVAKLTTSVTCVDIDSKGKRVAIAAEYVCNSHHPVDPGAFSNAEKCYSHIHHTILDPNPPPMTCAGRD